MNLKSCRHCTRHVKQPEPNSSASIKLIELSAIAAFPKSCANSILISLAKTNGIRGMDEVTLETKCDNWVKLYSKEKDEQELGSGGHPLAVLLCQCS